MDKKRSFDIIGKKESFNIENTNDYIYMVETNRGLKISLWHEESFDTYIAYIPNFTENNLQIFFRNAFNYVKDYSYDLKHDGYRSVICTIKHKTNFFEMVYYLELKLVFYETDIIYFNFDGLDKYHLNKFITELKQRHKEIVEEETSNKIITLKNTLQSLELEIKQKTPIIKEINNLSVKKYVLKDKIVELEKIITNNKKILDQLLISENKIKDNIASLLEQKKDLNIKDNQEVISNDEYIFSISHNEKILQLKYFDKNTYNIYDSIITDFVTNINSLTQCYKLFTYAMKTIDNCNITFTYNTNDDTYDCMVICKTELNEIRYNTIMRKCNDNFYINVIKNLKEK